MYDSLVLFYKLYSSMWNLQVYFFSVDSPKSLISQFSVTLYLNFMMYTSYDKSEVYLIFVNDYKTYGFFFYELSLMMQSRSLLFPHYLIEN